MPKPNSDCRATERKHPWPMVRLGDVCEVVLGGTPKTGITEYWDGDIPWLTPGDMGKITQMYVDASNCKRKISQLGLDNGSTLCPARSVILSTRAPIGYAFVNSVPMATNQGCKTLVPSDDVYPEYLCFNLLGRTDELNELGTGTTFKELATGRLKAMTLPLPPLSVQREIVARLERELATVEKMKKGFEELAETARADYLAECRVIFERIAQEHPKVSLDDACEFIKDGTHQTPTYTDDIYRGYKFLSSKDVVTGEIDWSKIRYIPKSLHDELYLHVAPQRGDILLAKNGTTGIGALVETDEVFDIYVSLALLRFKAGNNPRYLWYAVNSPQAREQYNAGLRGSGVPNLHLMEIRKVHICLPSVQIQDKVVSELDAIKARAEKLEAKAREGVAVCETMRKAILKEAFE